MTTPRAVSDTRQGPRRGAPPRRVLPLFVSGFGCPLRCAYCDQAAQTDAGAPLTPEDVAEALRAALARTAAGDDRPLEVAFYGGTFTALPEATQRALLDVVRRHRGVGRVTAVRVSTHPEWLAASHVRLLAECGVDLVEVGVQTLDDRVLRHVGRGTDAAGVEGALARLRAAGLAFGVQLMPGLPGADRASDAATAVTLARSGAALARVYPTLVLADTLLASWWRSGAYVPMTVDEAVARAADQVATLEAGGVRVQRIGLQVDGALRRAVVAGPLDEAIGERVRAEVAYRRLTALLATHTATALRIRVPSGEISWWVGRERSNLARLATDHPARQVRIAADAALARGAVCVEDEGLA